MKILRDPNERNAYAWIRMRIAKLWSHWISALKSKVIRKTVLNTQRRKRNVCICMLKCNIRIAVQFRNCASQGNTTEPIATRTNTTDSVPTSSETCRVS